MTTGMDISFGEEPISFHRRQGLEALDRHGVHVVESPAVMGETVREALGG